MKFKCLNLKCGHEFGWTAKRTIQKNTYEQKEDENSVLIDVPIIETWEFIVCPYCGSYDFDEEPRGHPPKPKNVPPVEMPKPASQSMPEEFNPEDLMKHQWKKGKRKPDGLYDRGSLSYGWDFKDQFNPATIKALEGDSITIDKYAFTLKGNFVSTKKAD